MKALLVNSGPLSVLTAAGRQVQADRRAFLPVAGNLQYAGAGEAAVGEQQVFEESRFVLLATGFDTDRQRQARELGKRRPGGFVKGQRHQRRAGRDDGQIELFGHAVAKIRRTDLGNGQAAAGDDHRAALNGATVAIYFIAACARSIRAGG